MWSSCENTKINELVTEIKELVSCWSPASGPSLASHKFRVKISARLIHLIPCESLNAAEGDTGRNLPVEPNSSFSQFVFFFFLWEIFPLTLSAESLSPVWPLIQTITGSYDFSSIQVSMPVMHDMSASKLYVCICNVHVYKRGRDTSGDMKRQPGMSTALEDWLSLLFSRVRQMQLELAENYLLQLMHCNCSGHIHKEENL